MFTQQMGQLFEPSKAKLLSKQQDHEMNMLMAKKAWETQSESLKLSKIEYGKLQTQIAAAETDLMERALPELVKASGRDGANANESAIVLENTTGKNLDELNALAINYRKMIDNDKTVLNNMVGFNEAAIVGEKFGTDYKGAKGARNYLEEFDTEPETPGFLSPEERENIKLEALRVTFEVKDIQNKKEGTDYITYTAAGEQVNIRPEGLAWVAGFDKDKAEIRHEKAEKARLLYKKPTADVQVSINEWLNLDAEWKKLSSDDQLKINQAREGGFKPEAYLIDSYNQAIEKDKLSAGIVKAGKSDRVQTLSDDLFKSEDAPGLFTGDVQKPYVEAGLSLDMYDKLRMMGSKADITRAAFERVIRTWYDLNDVDKETAVNKLLTEYAALAGR
jgi:hypothetical protein